MLKSKNVRIMLVLFAVMFVYTFVLGCEDTGGGTTTTVTIDGEEIVITLKDDGEIENLDTAVEKVVDPVLELGDTAVEEARDVLEDVYQWGRDQGRGQNDDDDDPIVGAGNFTDRSTQ